MYEEKVDGWRSIAYKDGNRVRLISRNGRDHTRRFREIAAAISKLSARTLVLDGEVAIYDQQLRSRFEWLRDPDPDAVASPPLLMAFDLLYLYHAAATGPPGRSMMVAPGWRTSWPAATWSSRCAASRRTAWRRGSRRSAGSGGSSGRTRDEAARSESVAGCLAAPRLSRHGVRRVRVATAVILTAPSLTRTAQGHAVDAR